MKIQEIAKKANVSTATVSRVFSNHPNIREELRERVLAVARETGYHPRLSQKQQNVIVISPFREIYPIRSYVEMVTSELALTLSARGYRIEMLPQDNLRQLEHLRFCGAVSIGIDAEKFGNWEERFAAPLVIIDRDVPPGNGEIYSVRSDETQAMHLGVDCLARHGCRKVGVLIYGEAGIGNTGLRREAVLHALRRHQLPISERLVRFALADSYMEEIGKLLKLGIDGLFCPGGNAGSSASTASSAPEETPESSRLTCSLSTTGAFRTTSRWSPPSGACTPATPFRRRPRSHRTTPHRPPRSPICSTPGCAATPFPATQSSPISSSNGTACGKSSHQTPLPELEPVKFRHAPGNAPAILHRGTQLPPGGVPFCIREPKTISR